METYKAIIKNIMKTDNNIFSFHYKSDGVDGLCKIFYSALLNKEITPKNKFAFFNESINNFIMKAEEEKKEIFINHFYNIQRVYNELKKYYIFYK